MSICNFHGGDMSFNTFTTFNLNNSLNLQTTQTHMTLEQENKVILLNIHQKYIFIPHSLHTTTEVFVANT